jgi:UDP-N-acetylmuramoylalanine--D-glutamate ligase
MKKIVILGAGESGAGSAVLALKNGFDVFVSDAGQVKDKYREILEKHQIKWEQGTHSEEIILQADEVIKSPGIKEDAPLVMKLRQEDIQKGSRYALPEVTERLP